MGGAPLPTPPAHRSANALSPTGTNYLVANWSGEGMLAVNPTNPLNIVGGSVYQAPASWNYTTAFTTRGVSGAYTSFDGGHTWLVQELPQLPEYSNTTNPECGHIHLADSVLTFGPNDTAYYVDLSYYPGDQSFSCTGSLASTGLYVTTSHDGGLTWGTPVAAAGANGGASIDKPWITVDQSSGTVYVAYTDDGNGSGIYFQRSTDQGASFSTPMKISNVADSMRGVELGVDPWGDVDATWVDQTSAFLYFCRSTNGGTSFSTPKVIARPLSEYGNPSPDAFRAYMLPGMGVDAAAHSPYAGRIYVTWQNGTGGVAHVPSIGLTWSGDNGTTWSPTVLVDNRATEDFQPDVAAGPDGTVYVEWYGENASSGYYRLYGSLSANGGANFSAPFNVSDVSGLPQFASTGGGNAWWIGDYTATIPTTSGVWAFWTDSRGKAAWSCSLCLWGYVYNISMIAAEMTRISITSNVPVNATYSEPGIASATTLVGANRTLVPALIGGNYSIGVPSTASANGSTWYFASWYGGSLASTPTLTGSLASSLDLHACYVLSVGAPCTAPGAPGYLTIQVTPTSATLTVNGSIVSTGGTGSVTLLEYPGTLPVRASLTNFVSMAVNATVHTAQTTRVTLALQPVPGVLKGSVSPTTATLALAPNGTLTTGPGGTFSATLAPGSYTLTATEATYTTLVQSITINPNATTWANLTMTLVPVGTLAGTVFPTNARLVVNGTPVAVSAGGTFSVTLLVGTYWANASATNYAPVSFGPIRISPAMTTRISLSLLPLNGSLVGTVSPASAALTVDGSVVTTSGGAFNLSLPPGNYSLTAAATGDYPWSGSADISANATTQLTIALQPEIGWVVGSVTPAQATLTIGGRGVSLTASGTFNASFAPGTYALVAEDSGYNSVVEGVTVHAGQPVHVDVALSSTTSALLAWSSPVPYLLIAVVLVAVGGTLLLLRRRGRRPPEDNT